MTALQVAESKYASQPEIYHGSLMDLLRFDQSVGQLCHKGVVLLPLTDCERPAELGVVQKLLELVGAAGLLDDRRSRKAERPPNRRLNYVKLARQMEQNRKEIKGPFSVLKVCKVSLSHQRGTVLAVVIRTDGCRPYGYFFHLKAAAFLCGMYQ